MRLVRSAIVTTLLLLACEVAAEEPTEPAEPAEPTEEADAHRVDTKATLTEQPRRPDRAEVISGEEIEAERAATLEDLIALVPGAQIQPGTGTSTKISIDGLPPGHLTILHNGVPVGRPVGGPQGPGIDLSAIGIEPTSIERIEIERGLGSGGASGVIINIVTRDSADRATVTSRAAASDAGLYREELAGSWHAAIAGDWMVGGEAGLARRSDADVDGDGAPDSPSSDNLFLRTDGAWRSGANHLALRLGGHVDVTRRDGAAGAPFDDVVRTREARLALDGGWQRSGGRVEHLSHVGRVDHTFEKVVRESGFVRPKSQTSAWRAGQTLASTWWIGDHDLTLAADARGEWVSREGETGGFDDVFVGEAGLSLGERWYASDSLELEAQARGSGANPYGLAAEGELGARLLFWDGAHIRTSISRTRRVPTSEELFLFFDHSEVGYQVRGNDDLQPEFLRSANLEIGWRGDGLEVAATGFAQSIADGIVTVAAGEGSVFTYDNRGDLGVVGVSGRFGAEIGLGLRFRADHTYLPLARDETGARLPLRPEHASRATLAGRWFENRLGARVWLTGRSSLTVPDGSPPAPAQLVANIGFDYSPFPWLETGIDLRNLTDTTHPVWGPQPGRYGLLTIALRSR